jgi:hypothetical protein
MPHCLFLTPQARCEVHAIVFSVELVGLFDYRFALFVVIRLCPQCADFARFRMDAAQFQPEFIRCVEIERRKKFASGNNSFVVHYRFLCHT